jgi:hypothetical protein
LTKVLKKEVTLSVSKGHNDSDEDEDMTKNDAFMTQMRDKLETCSLNSDSSEQLSDYLEAYTFRPLQKEGTPDSSEGQYTAETIIEIEDTQGQLVAARALLDTSTVQRQKRENLQWGTHSLASSRQKERL